MAPKAKTRKSKSPPRKEEAKVPPPNKANGKKKNDDQEDDDTVPRSETGWKNMLVKLVCLLLSVWLVRAAPLPNYDVQKPDNSDSFLSLYLNGGLDGVAFITQMLVAAFFSLFLDIGVVTFHVTTPPHPKFVMIPSRKFSIFVHLISGIVEIIFGVLAFTVGDPHIQRVCAITMSIGSITHALTAYYQTGIVFGAKGLMVPGYLYAITIHVANAIRLYQNPGSLIHLLFTFLVLHIYVWCRFFIFFFRACKMFSGYHYTVAISFSGLLLFPYAMGPVGNYGMLLVCIVYCTLEAILAYKDGGDIRARLFKEHERYALIDHKSVDKWQHSIDSALDIDSNKQAAKEVFDRFDTNKNGQLEVSEVYQMLSTLAVPGLTRKMLALADSDNDGSISFQEFYRYAWNIGSIKNRIHQLPKALEATMTDKEKAKLVFEMLDIDGSNDIGLAELELLLTQWGMPDKEAEYYLSKYVGGQKSVSFEVFYKQLRPIWTYGAEFVFN